MFQRNNFAVVDVMHHVSTLPQINRPPIGINKLSCQISYCRRNRHYSAMAVKYSIITKRLLAFLIDYIVIVIYIALLLGVTLSIISVLRLQPGNLSPLIGELIGFSSLTLPVILYFTLSENSRFAGTIGKRKLGLQVESNDETRASLSQLAMRNCIKFLPWELAHFFIYRLFYFSSMRIETPVWVLAGLIAAQALAIVYMLLIFLNKSNRSIYELVSGTRVVQQARN
jgi:uncharacterized RDD family membrane protein YckC